jgi:hypothetical protein
LGTIPNDAAMNIMYKFWLFFFFCTVSLYSPGC